MLVDVTRYHLEMTSPDQLVPGKFPPRPIEVERISTASAAEAGSTFERVGAAYHWRAGEDWSRRQWESHLSRLDIRSWLLRMDGEIAGMVELEAHDGDVEMITFGLVPELVGNGFGGHVLTLATLLAWEFEHPGG